MTDQVLFDRIALIGVGLIGSSIAHAARRGGLVGHITATARSEATRKIVADQNIADSVYETAPEAVADADLVIVNGGLGPTVDDLTAQILADVAGVPIEEHPQAVAHLQQWCAQRREQ